MYRAEEMRGFEIDRTRDHARVDPAWLEHRLFEWVVRSEDTRDREEDDRLAPWV